MIKIVANTPLHLIREAVQDDFGVVISNDDAKELREARKRGTLVWGADRITNVALDASIERIYAGYIRLRSGAVYSAKEWKGQNK